MSKIELPTITSGYNLSTINNNFQKIEDALNEEVLYRKGHLGEPNEMQTNLDMNGKQILNVVTGTSDGSLVIKGYVDQGLALKFDKSGGLISGSVDMNSNEILNVSRLSTNTLELGGVQVVPTNLAIDPYNGTREALRRSYAEAGYNLVAGSFEAGGALVNSNDVLLHEASGKAFSGPAGTVAAGTNPVGDSNWVPRTDETLRQEIVAFGVNLGGGAIQSRLDATPVGGTVVLQTGDENVSAGGLNNEFGKNIDVRNGRLFTPAGVQVSTYSEGPLRFVTGEQYLHFIHKKLADADGFTTAMKSNFVWSGDSTTEMVGSPMPPQILAYEYARRFGIADTVHVNLGHSSKSLVDWGNTYIDTEWTTYNAADCIILRWGINDPYFGTTLTQVKDALERGLSKLRAAKSVAQQSIVIMSPNSTADTPNGRDEKWYEQLNGVLRAAAKKHMCCFFDTYALYQESRRGAGIWLDDPYGDGRGIHPTDTFNATIHYRLLDIIYGPVMAAGGSTNMFSNNGSSLQFVSHAWGPATYHRGISFWRTSPSDAAWPLNGAVKVERYVDGLVKMSLMGFNDDGKQITMTRYGRVIGGAEAWTDWRGKRNPLPALQNGWTLGGSRQNTYMKSDDGIVTVTATLVAGTTTAGTVLLTMPVNYRPEFDLSYIVCGTESGVARIDVSSLNGNMTIRSMTGTILSINFSFPAKV